MSSPLTLVRMVFGGLVFIAYGTWSVQDAISFREKSTTDTGTIESVIPGGFYVTYTDSGGDEHSGYIKKNADTEDLEEGNTVGIRYDPDHPGRGVTADGPLWIEERYGAFAIVTGAFFACVGVYLMTRKKERETLY